MPIFIDTHSFPNAKPKPHNGPWLGIGTTTDTAIGIFSGINYSFLQP